MIISGSSDITKLISPLTSMFTVEVDVSSAATGMNPNVTLVTNNPRIASEASLGQFALKNAPILWILENLAKLAMLPSTDLIITITRIAGSSAITRFISGAGSIDQLIAEVVVVVVVVEFVSWQRAAGIKLSREIAETANAPADLTKFQTFLIGKS